MKIRYCAAILVALSAACGTADDPGVVTVLGYTVTIKTGPPLEALVGTAIPIAFTVTERLSDGTTRPAPGRTFTVAVTSGSGTINSVSSVTLTTADDGSVPMVWTLGQFPGTQTLRGTVAADHLDITVIASARPGTELAVVTAPSATGQVGVMLAQQPRIQVQDANHNPVAIAGVPVSVGISTGGLVSGGPLTVNTDASGVAAFSGLVLTGPANQNVTLTFTAPLNGLPAQVTATPTVLAAGAAARLVLKTSPSPFVQSGVALSTQPVVAVEDISGNVIIQPSYAVTARIDTGSGTLGGTTAINTNANGQATFTDLAVTGVNGAVTLGFTATLSGQGATVVSGLVTIGPWANKAPIPTGRLAAGSGVVGNVMYVVGGENAAFNTISTMEAYSPATNSWSTKAPMPTARSSFGVGVVNGILYAVGGESAGNALATVESYDPATNSWTTNASMLSPRRGHSVAVVNGVLYAVGGYNGSFFSTVTVEAYNPLTNSWTTKASAPLQRIDLATASLNGLIYAFGGYYDPYDSPRLPTMEAYDPATNSWTTRAQLPNGLSGLGAAAINGTIYAVGGGGPAEVATIDAYLPVTNSWSSKPPMPTGRQLFNVGVINGVLYVVGGWTGLKVISSMDAFVP